MDFFKKLLCMTLALSAVVSLSACGGNSISKALDMENFNTVQITASYVMDDLEAEDEEETTSSETSSDEIIYNDVEMDETEDGTLTSEDLKYKRYHDTYYEYAFGNEYYFYEDGGKYYRIISQPDYSNPEAFQNLWYKQEVAEETRISTTTFDYEAFSTLDKDHFKKDGNTYTLKDDYVVDFMNSLLKMDMTDDIYSNAAVTMTVEENKITGMCIEFLREERYQFTITYTLIYNDLKVQLPECTDKEPISY